MALRFLLYTGVLFLSLKVSANPFYAFQNGVRAESSETSAALLHDLGYDGIGSARLPAPEEVDAFFDRHEAKGVNVFSFYTGTEITDAEATIPPVLKRILPTLKGRDVTLEFYLKGDPSIPMARAADLIRTIADHADQTGTTLVLYPHTGMYIETFSDAVSVAKAVDRANVGVMFNLCHFLRVEPDSDLRDTLASAGGLLKQVSISGADDDGTDWKTLIQPLGEGTYDVSLFVRLLNEMQFNGPVGLQCFNVEGEPADYLKTSIDAWKAMQP